MLRHTFLHCPGIGEKRERDLWAQGYPHWEAFLGAHPPGGWRDLIAERLTVERAAHDLPRREAWRLATSFPGRIGYLDIETDGGTGPESITCVGLSDGARCEAFVAEDNLHLLPDALERFDLLVTYNGSCFDLPILQRSFPRIDFRRFHHVDLRWPLSRLGWRGGLKAAEREAGILRGLEVQGVDGWTAVHLWRAHREGHPRALETLLRYCLEDVVNLVPLMVRTYNRMVASLPIEVPPLLEGPRVEIPFRADPALVRDILHWQRGVAAL